MKIKLNVSNVQTIQIVVKFAPNVNQDFTNFLKGTYQCLPCLNINNSDLCDGLKMVKCLDNFTRIYNLTCIHSVQSQIVQNVTEFLVFYAILTII